MDHIEGAAGLLGGDFFDISLNEKTSRSWFDPLPCRRYCRNPKTGLAACR